MSASPLRKTSAASTTLPTGCSTGTARAWETTWVASCAIHSMLAAVGWQRAQTECQRVEPAAARALPHDARTMPEADVPITNDVTWCGRTRGPYTAAPPLMPATNRWCCGLVSATARV